MGAEGLDGLVERLAQRDVRAAARVISLLESDPDFAPVFIPALAKVHRQRPRLGVTGSPGVGKSTVVNALIRHVRGLGMRVGVVAVDPTSPFSGGALLGDRVRMNEFFSDDAVFIRSMGTRGSMGGLSAATANVVRVLEVFGSDVVFIETVGMGQTGFDIVDIADCVTLVLSPEAGDQIQTMKAGVMEIADIFVINKADRPGADAVRVALEQTLAMVWERLPWRPPVLSSEARTGKGIAEIWQMFGEYLNYLGEHDRAREKRLRQVEREIEFNVASLVQRHLSAASEVTPATRLRSVAQEVAAGRLTTFEAARRLLDELPRP
jgi:LAO/AO transport system kinase